MEILLYCNWSFEEGLQLLISKMKNDNTDSDAANKEGELIAHIKEEKEFTFQYEHLRWGR